MQPHRIATQIEVGPYEERVGIRFTFQDGTTEVFAFDEATAATLCHQGLAVVEALRQAREHATRGIAGKVGLSEQARVRLVKSGESE